MFPPGVPHYLVQAVRTAFDETMKDPKFLEDAHRMHIDPDPMTGEEAEKEIRGGLCDAEGRRRPSREALAARDGDSRRPQGRELNDRLERQKFASAGGRSVPEEKVVERGYLAEIEPHDARKNKAATANGGCRYWLRGAPKPGMKDCLFGRIGCLLQTTG